MNCPRCPDGNLEERERDGVVVDVCRGCRGMWLDRGELEKLLARAHDDEDPPSSRDPRRGAFSEPRDGYGTGRPPKRKKSWFESLGDVFD